VLNLNVPNLALAEIRGVRRAGLASSGLIIAAQAVNGGPKVRFDLGASPSDGDESDETLTQLGWAVVTPLVSVSEDKRPETAEIVTAAMASAAECLEMARATSN
jgi:hypothetical protein